MWRANRSDIRTISHYYRIDSCIALRTTKGLFSPLRNCQVLCTAHNLKATMAFLNELIQPEKNNLIKAIYSLLNDRPMSYSTIMHARLSLKKVGAAEKKRKRVFDLSTLPPS